MSDGADEVRAMALRLAELEGADREWKRRIENLIDGLRRTTFGVKGDNGVVGDSIKNQEAIEELRKAQAAIWHILHGDGGATVGHAGRIRDLESVVRHGKFIIVLTAGSGGLIGFLVSKLLQALGIGA